jgi:hypothetical protein
MVPILDFQRHFWDERTNLPVVDPVHLPCSHIISKKHIEILTLKKINQCPKSVIRNGELTSCKTPFDESLLKSSESTAKTIEEFINRNGSYFTLPYSEIKERSNTLYSKQIKIFEALNEKNIKRINSLKEKKQREFERSAALANAFVISLLFVFVYYFFNLKDLASL